MIARFMTSLCLLFIYCCFTPINAQDDRTEISENDEYRSIVVGKGPVIPESNSDNVQIIMDDPWIYCRDPHFNREYCHHPRPPVKPRHHRRHDDHR